MPSGAYSVWPRTCLEVHRPARDDECSDVGNGVADAIPVPRARCGAPGRDRAGRGVDRDERMRRRPRPAAGGRSDISASSTTAGGKSGDTSRLWRRSAKASAISASSGAGEPMCRRGTRQSRRVGVESRGVRRRISAWQSSSSETSYSRSSRRRAPRAARLLFVGGEAGVGKTTLVRRSARAHPCASCAGRART